MDKDTQYFLSIHKRDYKREIKIKEEMIANGIFV
jgi:hypothetical protein